MLFFAALLFALPLLNRFLIPRAVRKQFAQRPSLADSIGVRWDENGIVFESTNAHNVQPWATLHRWIADENTIVLLPTDRMIQLVPTRVLTAEQLTDLSATLLAHGPAPG